MIEPQGDGVYLVRPFLSVTTGIVVLFIGKALNGRFRPLQEFNIPEPVTGGLLFALCFWLMHSLVGLQVDFELTARDILLVYFFTTIGINARFRTLRAGGVPLAKLLLITAAAIVVQNLVGIGVAWMTGNPAALGLLAGSASLTGGHGTTIAWAQTFQQEFGIEQATEIGIICATAGLLLGSICGGPVAKLLIQRHHLRGPVDQTPEVGITYRDNGEKIDYFSFLQSILALHISAIVGVIVNDALDAIGIQLPLFVTCLMSALLLTNLLPMLAPRVRWPSQTMSLALIAEVTLGVFLAMSIMSMQIWRLGELSGTMGILLLAQCSIAVLMAVLLVYPLMGARYDAAVISAGYLGFTLGATPTAMANMTAVTQRHGASHIAFLIVPLVGAFFIDLINAFFIRLFVSAIAT